MNIFAYRGCYRTVTGTRYIPGYKSVRLPNMHASRPGAKPSATLQTDRHAYNARKRELSISLQTRDHPAFLPVHAYVCRISRLQLLINEISITFQTVSSDRF